VAQAIRAELASKHHALEVGRRAGYQARNAEYQAFWEDRKAMRAAIQAKYQYGLDRVWKAAPKVETGQADRVALFAKTAQRMQQRQQNFEANERSFMGRIANVTGLLRPEQRRSIGAFVKLALSKEDRRREFDRQQLVIRQAAMPDRAKPGQRGPQPATLSRRNMSDRLKMVRTVEFQQFDQETKQLYEAMKDRHGRQVEGEKAQNEALTQESANRWSQHNAVPDSAETSASLSRR